MVSVRLCSTHWTWAGKGSPGSGKGNWIKPGSDEFLHPDRNHAPPIGPDWDWRDPGGDDWRLFPDGTYAPSNDPLG